MATEPVQSGLPLVHPGELLADEIAELGLSRNAFAKALGMPANRITAITNGTRGITPETAIALSEYFGTSADLWLNLQKNYDLRQAEREKGKSIRRIVAGLKENRP